jgi:hypothetical protein
MGLTIFLSRWRFIVQQGRLHHDGRIGKSKYKRIIINKKEKRRDSNKAA